MNAQIMQNLVDTNPDTTVQAAPTTAKKARSSDLRLAVTELLQAKPLSRNEIRTALDIQPGTSEAARLESTLSNFKRAGLTLCKEGKLHLQEVVKAVKGPRKTKKKTDTAKEATPAAEASAEVPEEKAEGVETSEAPSAPEEAATVNTAAVADEPTEEAPTTVEEAPLEVVSPIPTTPATTTEESLANHISVVLGGGQMTFDEVFTALANRGWLPNSTNPRAFVYHTLNKVQQSFAKNPSRGVTRYLAVG